MAKRQITIGGLDASTHFLTDLAFPILEEVDAMAVMSDCLVQAADERKGVAVLGGKGSGKTIALRPALDRFMEAERLKERADGKYIPRRIVQVRSLRASNHRDALIAIWQAALGVAPNLKLRGRRKTEDELRNELVEHLLNMSIAILVFDEAETLGDAALEVIRDLMSCAEDRSKNRIRENTYAPAGIGVLAVGTERLQPRIEASDEAGHRWIRFQHVGNVSASLVPHVYRRFLPGLEAHIQEVGEEEWALFIQHHVSQGHDLPIRFVENHARAYARIVSVENPWIHTVGEIPFDEEIFLYALTETVRPRVYGVDNEAA